MRITLLLLLITPFIQAQEPTFRLPKYPPKLKKSTRDSGPKPGTVVKNNQPSNTTFRRVYSFPTALRLLVRTNCDTRPGRKELIDRAKAITLDDGPPVQIDWETIRGDKVSYWAVVSSNRVISHLNLGTKQGKYVVSDKKTLKQEDWDVQKLTLGKVTCESGQKIDNKTIRKSVINILNQKSLQNFRKNPRS